LTTTPLLHPAMTWFNNSDVFNWAHAAISVVQTMLLAQSFFSKTDKYCIFFRFGVVEKETANLWK